MRFIPPFMEINYSNISENWMDFFLGSYKTVMGVWVWPLIFLGIVGYVYAVQKSATAAAVALCLIFGIFGATDVLSNAGEFTQFSQIMAVFSIAGAFTALFIKHRK